MPANAAMCGLCSEWAIGCPSISCSPTPPSRRLVTVDSPPGRYPAVSPSTSIGRTGASGSLFAYLTPELGDAGGSEDQGEEHGPDVGEQQRDGQRGAGGHPQERDLRAAGVLHQEDDQEHGQERGADER